MAGRVADARQARQGVERVDQLLEPAPFIVAPGVDVLAEQGDLARAGIDQRLRFVEDRREFSADLGAARKIGRASCRERV